jgi:hypothetical protein
VNDDKIVACLVRDRRKHIDAKLVCVTTDNALAYKVGAKGFTVIDPAEDDRLPDETDPREAPRRAVPMRPGRRTSRGALAVVTPLSGRTRP